MSPLLNTCQQLIDLGLKGMANAYDRQLDDPALQKQKFDVRLGLMLDAENSERETRRIERLLKTAKLRESQATIESIEYLSSRHLDRNTIMNLADCEWLRRQQNLIMTGATGTGKTWLACAFGNQACRLGFSTYYKTSVELFEEIATAFHVQSQSKLRRKLINTRLLIIDDLGVPSIPAELGPFLLDVIDRQSSVGSLLITSQFPQEHWHKLFTDPTIADAILDRIVHKSHSLQLEGESMRKKRYRAK